MSDPKPNINPEVLAISQIDRAIQKLPNDEARRRVLNFVDEVHFPITTATNGNGAAAEPPEATL